VDSQGRKVEDPKGYMQLCSCLLVLSAARGEAAGKGYVSRRPLSPSLAQMWRKAKASA
jgi:hypothetical protein